MVLLILTGSVTLERIKAVYDNDELAKMRHDAFLEQLGLDPNDFEN